MKKIISTLALFIAMGLIPASAGAKDQTPEQACAHIKAQDCYKAIQCNKQKRQYAACVKEQQRNKHPKQKMPAKPKH